MSELRMEKEETGKEFLQLTDCGRASQVTRGIPLVLLFELGTPPFNKMFLF